MRAIIFIYYNIARDLYEERGAGTSPYVIGSDEEVL
jgi:hypothetical protein